MQEKSFANNPARINEIAKVHPTHLSSLFISLLGLTFPEANQEELRKFLQGKEREKRIKKEGNETRTRSSFFRRERICHQFFNGGNILSTLFLMSPFQ